MGLYLQTNPGEIELGQLTTDEVAFIQHLESMGYSEGDLLYYDGTQLNRLGIGTEGQFLTVASGIPSWGDSSSSIAWGGVTGTLSDQTDLQNALDDKADTNSLADVATTGDYDDLINKPSIPAAQVNSDWNSNSGVAQILNKPSLDFIPTSEKGSASGVAPLDSNSKIDASYLPAIAITETFVVASEIAQLALTAQEGDVCIRTDENKTYIQNGGTSGTMADWTELRFPSGGGVSSVAMSVPTGLQVSGSPITSSGTFAITYALGYQGYTGAEARKLSGIEAGAEVNTVDSVAGKTGVVTLVKGDVGLGNVDNTSDLNKPISTATQNALDAKANDNTVVKLTGNQTVGGVKTFSSFPVTPSSAPTTDYQTANKKYVDDKLATFIISLNFIDEQLTTIKAPYDMQIDTVSAEAGSPVIKVNGSAYTLGDPIDQFDEIEVDAGAVDRLVNLNCTKL